MVSHSETTSSVEVVRVEDRHVPALAEFYRAVWDAHATEDSVRRARDAAGVETPTFLFLNKGRALGHVTTIPQDLHGPGGIRRAHWLKGLMVLPEHRNGPVGMLVLKEAVRQLGTAMAMVVQPAPRRLFAALGFADLGAVPNAVKLLRPARVLARLDARELSLPAARVARPVLQAAQKVGVASLAGAAVGLAAHLWTRVAGARVRSLAATEVEELDPAVLDTLWQRARARIAAAPSRDGTFMRRRYAIPPYRATIVQGPAGPAALAVVRAPSEQGDARLRGLRVATLSDLVVSPDDPGAALAAVAAAERLARDLDADAIVCSASHAALRGVLRRRAFAPLGGNMHFMLRDPAGGGPAELQAWWLMRGDSNADEIF